MPKEDTLKEFTVQNKSHVILESTLVLVFLYVKRAFQISTSYMYSISSKQEGQVLNLFICWFLTPIFNIISVIYRQAIHLTINPWKYQYWVLVKIHQKKLLKAMMEPNIFKAWNKNSVLITETLQQKYKPATLYLICHTLFVSVESGLLTYLSPPPTSLPET